MFTNLTIAGGIGALLGIALVWLIEPAETGGIGFLILIPTVAFTVLGGILSLLFGKKKTKKKASDDKDNGKSDDETSKAQTGDDSG
jgi:hypothetical protein